MSCRIGLRTIGRITRLTRACPYLVSSLFSDGFENDFTPWDGYVNTPKIETTIVHSGLKAMKIDVEDTPTYAFKNLAALEDKVKVVIWVRIQAKPTNPANNPMRSVFVETFQTAAHNNNSFVGEIYRAHNTARLYFRFGVHEYGVYLRWFNIDEPEPEPETWYKVEMAYEKHTSVGRFRVCVDDLLKADRTNKNMPYTVGRLEVGTILGNHSEPLYMDDVEIGTI